MVQPPGHSVSELRHNALVKFDVPPLAQVSGLMERPTLLPGGKVLDFDYRSNSRKLLLMWDCRIPDDDPAIAGEQTQFDTALRVYFGYNG